MSRTFDGTNDEIRCAIGNCNLSTEAKSVVVVAKRDANSAYHTLFTLHDSGGTIQFGLEVGNDGGHVDELQSWDGSNVRYSSGGTPITFTVANNWCLLGFTKATGTVTADWYKYVYDTNTMTTATSSGTVVNNTAPGSSGTVRFGEWEDVDDYEGHLAAAALFDVKLTQDQIQSMAFSLQAWLSLNPRGMWVFDQASTGQTLLDWTGGGANQSTITGTSISTSSVPVLGYGYASPLVIRPKASVVATVKRLLLMGVG